MVVTPLLSYNVYYAPTPLLNYRYYSQARSQNSAMGRAVAGGWVRSPQRAKILCFLAKIT